MKKCIWLQLSPAVCLGIAVSILSWSAQSAVSKNPAAQVSKVQTPAKVTGDERSLYREVTVAYEQNDFELFLEKFKKFEQQFSGSIFMDDAHYMLGMMHAGRKDYGNALKTFNEALKKFPSSNRLRTLILSKGTTLKRMNLNELAEDVFEQVKKRFPGSPEALRADLELKLIKQ